MIMLSKLSSKRMILATSFTSYVHAIPIANPTSAFLRTEASPVPSPVIATTFPICFRPTVSKYLSSQDDLVNNLNSFAIF